MIMSKATKKRVEESESSDGEMDQGEVLILDNNGVTEGGFDDSQFQNTEDQQKKRKQNNIVRK